MTPSEEEHQQEGQGGHLHLEVLPTPIGDLLVLTTALLPPIQGQVVNAAASPSPADLWFRELQSADLCQTPPASLSDENPSVIAEEASVPLTLPFIQEYLVGADFADYKERLEDRLEHLIGRHVAVPRPAEMGPSRAYQAFKSYFDKTDMAAVHRLQMFPLGATAFQKRVYALMLQTNVGTTVTYGELAGRLGRPRGARAIGGAVRRNPIIVALPCHRVVGADATNQLVGFSSGLQRKKWLLYHEGAAHSSRLAKSLSSLI